MNCSPQIVDGLFAIARLISDPNEQPPKLEHIVQLLERLGLLRGTVMLLSGDDRKLTIAAAQGVGRKQTEHVIYYRNEGIVGLVIATQQAITLTHPHLDPRFLNRVHRRDREQAERIIFICVPIVLGGKAIGTLSADIPRHGDINADFAVRLLSILASMIAPRAAELRPSAIHSLPDRIRTIEMDMMNAALQSTNGNIAAAARQLGITARMARYKIRQLGIRG